MTDSNENGQAAEASVEEIVMPPIGDMRNATNDLLSAINEHELATALKKGNRISAYQPFADWLREPDRGDLYVRQMIDCLLFDVFDRKDTKTMGDMLMTVAGYVRDMSS